MTSGWLKSLKSLCGGSSTRTAMLRRSVQCISSGRLHRMSYTQWGEPDNPKVLVCVHGLTRNARDFDDLARAMSTHCRVICPDVAGRGRSDWLVNKADYAIPAYVQHMVTLIARLDVEQVDWLGTSMGGLIGMGLASLPENPVRRLVLNDVGPVLAAQSLLRIGEYVGRAPAFPDLDAATAYVKLISAGFGDLSPAQWHHLTEHSMAPGVDGWRMRYDPAIGDVLRATPVDGDVALWPIYDAIRCPTLVVRGADSDLLSRGVAEEMTRRGPKAQFVEVPGVGHAPMLMDEAQIAVISQFLRAGAEPKS